MRKLISVALLALMISTTVVLLHKSGIVQDFGDAIHQRNGWKEIPNGYSKTIIETMYVAHIAILKDPQKTSLNIYEGAMKKSAVDRMELQTVTIIRVMDLKDLRPKITAEVNRLGCNTAIINYISTSNVTKTKAFAM